MPRSDASRPGDGDGAAERRSRRGAPCPRRRAYRRRRLRLWHRARSAPRGRGPCGVLRAGPLAGALAATATTARRTFAGGIARGVAVAGARACGILRPDGLRLGRGGEASLGAGRDVEVGEQVRARRVRLDGLGLAELERTVDERPLVQVVPVDEGHGDAGLAGAAGAPGAVQVGLLVVGDRVVDHVRDVIDVDAAGGDVGRDQDVLLAGLERGHRALARLLAHVAVHRGRVEPAVAELVGQTLGGTLGAREDHGLAAAVGLEDAGDDLVLVQRVRAVDEVVDVRLGETLIGVGRPDVDRVGHEPARQRDDRAGHRGREKLRVPDGGDLREDLLDVGEEAEVEHLVGLVEHDLGRVRQVEQSLVVQVDEATRCADDDLRACLELIDLALVRLAAVDGHDAGRAPRGEHVDVLVDLDAQFAGRDDDQRLDAVLGVGTEALHHGDAEAEGLPGAGLGLSDDVLAGKAEGDGLLLDGECVHDALGGEGLNDVLVDAEFGEGRHDVCLSGSETLPECVPWRDPMVPRGRNEFHALSHPQAREPRSDAGDAVHDTGGPRL